MGQPRHRAGFSRVRYVRYLVGSNEKAIDIVQESFISAYINLNGFDIKSC